MIAVNDGAEYDVDAPVINLNTLLNVASLALLLLGGFALVLLREGALAAVKRSAEEGVTATIQKLQWPAILARELQKTRALERQELRFKSYGALWKELRPLAIYDEAMINKEVVSELSSKLSNWYFSECGGLLLTPQARDFYFALQDLLRATSQLSDDWDADRSGSSEGDQSLILRDILAATSANEAISTLDYLSTGTLEDWENQAAGLAQKWRRGVNCIAATWTQLDGKQRFATLQQVGSILRTSLTVDLESRLR